jgi:hypothetical protein
MGLRWQERIVKVKVKVIVHRAAGRLEVEVFYVQY